MSDLNSSPPKHIVAVSGYVINERGEMLLVKTGNRGDTWELPGGQVEELEPLHEALRREVWEETGINVEPLGVTGIHFNATRGIVTVVFAAKAVGGEITPSDETPEVRYILLTHENIEEIVTRPHFRQRILDAMTGRIIPYAAFKVEPFEWLARLEP